MPSGTVLYVDDDRDFADLVDLRLTRELDYDVESVRSADAAFERLAEGDVVCLVLDYRLPGMSGPEVLEAVTERYPDVPVVFFSGMDAEETAAEMREAGASAFVQKDVGSFDALADAVRDAVAE
ncbi:response regulator [Halarchaeum sp. P4]|uniref:response regulator n=1 Tax=Halarchaeum sp. P4 TaxID=3421639 RepID=UPI003EBA36EE